MGRPAGARDGSVAAERRVTVFADAVAMEAGAAGGHGRDRGRGGRDRRRRARRTWPLGPGGTGTPGAAGSTDDGAAAWPGLATTFAVRNTTSSRLAVSVRSFLKSQPSTGILESQGIPCSSLLEVLLAKAGDHHGAAVRDVGLRDGLPRGDDRGATSCRD